MQMKLVVLYSWAGETLLILLHLDTVMWECASVGLGQNMRILMCGLVLFIKDKYL